MYTVKQIIGMINDIKAETVAHGILMAPGPTRKFNRREELFSQHFRELEVQKRIKI